MCGITGIAGFSGKPVPADIPFEKMVDSLRHRGPDEKGIEKSGQVYMGARRLSIIDLQNGQQPVRNENGMIVATQNGEIYNYRQLTAGLKNAGHRFISKGDTEPIVHAYEQYGVDFFKQLEGMFAIALHDRQKNILLLGRDRAGIKPLYYCVTSGFIIWGSEIKAILASGLIDKRLNLNALPEYLAWEYVPGPHTLFNNIYKILPGHYLEVDLNTGAHRLTKYWDIMPDSEKTDLADQINKADWLIKESVQSQMISDVPLGAFLSGGIDSSLIVNAMKNAETFTIGFPENSYNELPYAKQVAEITGNRNISEMITHDVLGDFEFLLGFLDDPIADFSIFPTYLVSKLSRQHVKVVLSGDGGDELFGGYETYTAQNLAARIDFLPTHLKRTIASVILKTLKPTEQKKGFTNKVIRMMQGMLESGELKHARWRLFAGEKLLRELIQPEFFGYEFENNHIYRILDQQPRFDEINQWLMTDFRSYLADNILVKVDRMSMAASLETRVPFLDSKLIEFAFNVPGDHKIGIARTKILLKKIAEKYFPREIVHRPKQGFSIPVKNWLINDQKHLLKNYLNEKIIQESQIFNWEKIEELIRQHQSGRANHSHILWALIVFNAWKKRWLD